MKRNRAKRRLNCVALKRRAQAKIYADTKQMTAAEQIEYFRRRAESGALGAWWKRVPSVVGEPPALVVREKPRRYGR